MLLYAVAAEIGQRGEIHELPDDGCRAVRVGIRGISPVMRFEDVVHHREAKASHQLPVELQMAVLHAVPEPMEIGARYGLSCSQVGIAWALSKGTMPIIGATKERHVLEAAQVMDTVLTPKEISRLEVLADAAGIDTRGDWEHTME